MILPLAGLLVVIALGCAVAGRIHAIALAGADPAAMHSRPSYHGWWLALVATGPALLILVFWSAIEPRILRLVLFAQFGAETSAMGRAERDGFWRDVQAIAHGDVSGFNDPLRDQGAALLGRFELVGLFAMVLVMVVVGLVGFILARRAITPAFRARHRVEAVVKAVLAVSAGLAVLITIGIVLSLIAESLRFFALVSPLDFLFGLAWTPQQMALRPDQVGGTAAFGLVPLLTGTLLITAIAMAVAAPVGIMAAVYLSEYASSRARALGKPFLEILAGIPTVVYGFFAALTVAPLVRQAGQALGLEVASESALAAGIVMGLMIVPFVSSLTDDVIRAVPQSLRDGSLGLGATPSETIRKVVLPAALPGIVSALVLAVSRAIGETMIVVMAAGMAARLSLNPFEAVTTVTVQISMLLTGDQEFDSPKTLAAFGLGLVLFVITLTLNLVALRVVRKYREQYD
jgi:phosphate transport system permease protein